MLVVTFHKARAHTFPYIKGEIKEGAPNNFEYMQLLPGKNINFPKDVLEKIKTHPDFIMLQDLGDIEVGEEPDKTDEAKDLGGVKAITSGKDVGDNEPMPINQPKRIKTHH